MKQECPICGSKILEEVWSLKGMPTIVNQVYSSREEAENIQRGDIAFVLCSECQFVFNKDFDHTALNYGSSYDNRQVFSSVFLTHMQGVADKIAKQGRLQNKIVVEVGCGKGDFLKLLVGKGSDHIIGYDTTYQGILNPQPGLEFRQQYLTPEEKVDCDVLVSRHVIEHIEYPKAFLSSIAQSLPNDKTVKIYFETPSMEWIFGNLAFWDFLYEHCSFFSMYSLAKVFSLSGYYAVEVTKLFGDQYLLIEAEKGPTPKFEGMIEQSRVSNLSEKIKKMKELLEFWKNKVDTLTQTGKIWLWGGGGKGVSFISNLGDSAKKLSGVIDINPNKQNKYIASGHVVRSPQQAIEEGVSYVIICNPNYREEIEAELQRCGSQDLQIFCLGDQE